MRNILWILAFAMVTLGAKDTVDTKHYIDSVKSAQIETKELYKLIKEDVEDLYIVDIREPDQVGHGEIFHLNLVTITRGYLEFKIENQIKNKKARIVVYCCTGKEEHSQLKHLMIWGTQMSLHFKVG